MMLHERRAEERAGVRFAFALVVLGLLMLSAVLLLPGAEAVTTLNSTRVTTSDIHASGRTSLGGVAATTNDALHVEGSSLFNGTIWANASFGQANFLRVGNWTGGPTFNFTNATATAFRTITFPDSSGTVALADVANNIAWASVNKAGSSLADLATREISDTTGTLATTRGGTGLTTYATGDLLYASGADTLSRLAVGAEDQYLRVSSGVPIWGTLSTVMGTGTANRVSYWTATDTISSDADLLFDGTSLTVPSTTVTATKALVLGPTSSATLPAAVEGALVYDTTNDVFKGGISGSPSYRVLAMLETANTWTATQTFGTTATTSATITGLGVGSTATVVNSAILNLRGAVGTSDVESRQRGFDVRPAFTEDVNNGFMVGFRVQPDYNTNSKTGTSAHGLLVDMQQGTYTGTPDEAIALMVNCPSFATSNFCADFVGGDIRLRAGVDLSLDTVTGTKFATSTTQKMGWYGATPVVRQTCPGDPGGGAVIDAQSRAAINSLLDVLIAYGFCQP